MMVEEGVFAQGKGEPRYNTKQFLLYVVSIETLHVTLQVM